MRKAYLQKPSHFNNDLYFVTDDDIWTASLSGGIARRITNHKGLVTNPHISPDGKHLVYLTNELGQWDIYLTGAQGGVSERITYCSVIKIIGWKNNNTIIFRTNESSFHLRAGELFELNIETKIRKKINLGPATFFQKGSSFSLLGRNNGDPAYWKRYRGGTAGTLWVDAGNKGNFKQILKKLPTNITNPMIIEERIYFISDHEGIGNIYSVNSKGLQIKAHSNQKDFYVRSFQYSNGIISYECGADLWKLDLTNGSEEKINIEVYSTFNQASIRYDDAIDYLQNFSISAQSSELSIISRGQLFSMAPWSGGAVQWGDRNKRYRLSTFVKGKKTEYLLAIELDEENEETLIRINMETDEIKKVSVKHNWGKIYSLCASKKSNVAISNNRKELFLLDIDSLKVQKIDSGKIDFIKSMSWSPCSQFLAYNKDIDKQRRGLFIYDLKTKKSRSLITPVLEDRSPTWDPEGDYLYFIGIREFQPNYNETHFDLGFPFALRPYVVVLNKDAPSPLDIANIVEEEEEESPDTKKNEKKDKKENKKEEPTQIDWDGIEQRVLALPLSLGGYESAFAAKDRLFFIQTPILPTNPLGNKFEPDTKYNLYSYCFKDLKKELWAKDVHGAELSNDGKHIIVYTEDELRVVSSEAKPTDGEEYNKKDGWIDLSRVKLQINPREEWKQIYQEAWILQREHFWTADMSKINWKNVYKKYLPILDKVNTRKEFSDIMWEMQGELGTSHCYEFFGDYNRHPEPDQTGYLGAEFKFDPKKKGFVITKIYKGDSWIAGQDSPLSAPSVSLSEGDLITQINGINLLTETSLEQELESLASRQINLTIKRKNSKEIESVYVKTLGGNSGVLYRQWVEANKEYVHKKSKGKVGYVHVPNMAVQGYSEFYRHYIVESQYEALIVDVRYNGGGHVSQHLLKVLAQRVIGYDQTRYFGSETYPMYAVNGPVICLTNEHAGSDGDIFSHSFKLMKLGKLIGKRTWGGVVGIWPRVSLKDGTYTSQPEFSFWFKDVGYAVENYGTDPDIEVDILPSDYKKGIDTQLDRSIAEALKDMKKTPALKANLNQRPNLKY